MNIHGKLERIEGISKPFTVSRLVILSDWRLLEMREGKKEYFRCLCLHTHSNSAHNKLRNVIEYSNMMYQRGSRESTYVLYLQNCDSRSDVCQHFSFVSGFVFLSRDTRRRRTKAKWTHRKCLCLITVSPLSIHASDTAISDWPDYMPV